MSQQTARTAKTHEWARVENDPAGGKTATVGLTAFALEALTDLVHIELPKVGPKGQGGRAVRRNRIGQGRQRPLQPGRRRDRRRSTRQSSTILEHLADDPYEAGWFVKIKIGDEAGLADLLDEAAYKKQCEEEQH